MKKLFFILITNVVFGQAVSIDPTFGVNGVAVTANTLEMFSFAYDKDGNIISIGQCCLSSVYQTAITKHNSDGILDTSFGTNGVVIVNDIPFNQMFSIAIQSDNKILVGGYYINSSGRYGLLSRYLLNGTLDATFGLNGHLFLDTIPDFTSVYSIIILSDNSIILAGQHHNQINAKLIKVTSNGSIENSFGSNGVKNLNDTNFNFFLNKSILLSDNTILCVGFDFTNTENMKTAFCKVNINGNFVTSFGNSGKVVRDISNAPFISDESLHVIKEMENGQIVLGGFGSGANLVCKIDSNGSFVSSFGTNGVLVHYHPFEQLELQGDGKILLGGSNLNTTSNPQLSLTRLNIDGVLDNTFNSSGTYYNNFSNNSDYLHHLRLQGNKLLVGGFSATTSNFMLARLDLGLPLTVLENTTSQESVSVFPNPSNSYITIGKPKSKQEPFKYKITDVTGRVIQSDVSSYNDKIEIIALKIGNYFIEITDKDNRIVTQKLLKQ
jgi:uncharacterized delta-60 repeat protein